VEAGARAVRRGHLLLRFLDKHIARLLGEDNKPPPAAGAGAGAAAAAPAGGGFMAMFNIRSLFGEAPPAPDAVAAGARVVPVAEYLQELVTLPWIPVLQVGLYLGPYLGPYLVPM